MNLPVVYFSSSDFRGGKTFLMCTMVVLWPKLAPKEKHSPRFWKGWQQIRGWAEPQEQISFALLPMNMTEDFRREARVFLAYSRLWLSNVKALSW